MVDCLPSMCKVLGSIPNTTKKGKGQFFCIFSDWIITLLKFYFKSYILTIKPRISFFHQKKCILKSLAINKKMLNDSNFSFLHSLLKDSFLRIHILFFSVRSYFSSVTQLAKIVFTLGSWLSITELYNYIPQKKGELLLTVSCVLWY